MSRIFFHIKSWIIRPVSIGAETDAVPNLASHSPLEVQGVTGFTVAGAPTAPTVSWAKVIQAPPNSGELEESIYNRSVIWCICFAYDYIYFIFLQCI